MKPPLCGCGASNSKLFHSEFVSSIVFVGTNINVDPRVVVLDVIEMTYNNSIFEELFSAEL